MSLGAFLGWQPLHANVLAHKLYKQLHAKDHSEPVPQLGPPGTTEKHTLITRRTDGRRQHLCRLPDQFRSSCQEQGTFVHTPVLFGG